MIACINGKLTTIQNPSQLVQGTVGQKMRVAIPEEMEDLAVTAVFTAGSVQRDVAVLGEEITIPWEVLADPAQDLRLCFHASSANGQRVFTTADSDPLKILPSTPPSGQAPEAPTPTRADQIQALAEDALAAAQSVRRDADSGAFDGTDGVNGQDGISPLVAVSETSGGHTISITDAEGVKSFDVLDGADGEVLQADLDELEASVADTLETKADIDGSYDDMTVGNARQLVSTVYTADRTPYLFRTAGGSADIGDRLTEKLIGGTIAWNQLIKADYSNTYLGNTTKSVNDGECTITVNSNNSPKVLVYNDNLIAGHVYLITADLKSGENTPEVCVGMFSNEWGSKSATTIRYTQSTTYIRQSIMGKSTAAGDKLAVRLRNASSVGDTATVKNFNVFDLTQMFGSAIADYIYTLETNTAGAGAAYFRKLFPKPFYAYDAGSLQSVKTSAHKTVGFNAWDEEWEVGFINATTGQNTSASTTIRSKNYIPVEPNTKYYAHNGTITSDAWFTVRYYDSDKNYIGDKNADGTQPYWNNNASHPVVTPPNACYMRFVTNSSLYPTTYKNDICINLSWDGERNGEYEAYVQHTYALDSDLELRGIPKLDANNSLYYDGDEYASDGTVTRKYGIVDLGAQTWSYSIGGQGYFLTNGIASLAKAPSTNGAKANVLCPKYDTISADAIYQGGVGIGLNKTPQIWAHDGIHTGDDLVSGHASWLEGVYLVYELATPATESADAFQSPQIVDDFGTEEYVDAAVAANTRDVAVPVGHDTLYQNNLRAKLEMAPESPGSNGDYIVRHTHGQNRYIAYTDGGRISGLEERLPAPPSVDGSYCLRVTISGGAAQYAWAAC